MADRSTTRFALIFAGGTMISRVLGLVSYTVIGAYIPRESRDIFFLAFRFPNMLRDMLGEGAVNAAFVPVFSATHEKEPEAVFRELVAACMGAMLLLFGAITLLGVIVLSFWPALLHWLQPWTGATDVDIQQVSDNIHLMQWTFPYLLLIGLAVFATAPLFTLGHYGTASWSPALLNVALIACAMLLYNRFQEPATALVVGAWIGGIAQVVVVFIELRRKTRVLWPNFRFRLPGVRHAFWLMIPVILGQSAGEINKLVDATFAASMGEGVVSAFNYANRLIQLPLAIFGVAVSVSILPAITRAATRGDYADARAILVGGLRQSFFVVLPAMLGLMVMAEPVVRLLFEMGEFTPEDTQMTSLIVVYLGLGLLSFSWVKVSVQGFYARHETLPPVVAASVSMILNIVLIFLLVPWLHIRGLALATTISYTVNFLLLYLLLHRRFGAILDFANLIGLLRLLFAGLVMGAVAWGLHAVLEQQLGHADKLTQAINALIPIAAAILTYFALCHLLRAPEFNDFKSILQRRFRHRAA